MKTRQIQQRLQTQTQLSADRQDVAVQTAIIEERDQQIAGLQKEMTDVNELFKEIALMVEDQGEIVTSIETNVKQANQNVETAKKEIEKANDYSKKTCCLI